MPNQVDRVLTRTMATIEEPRVSVGAPLMRASVNGHG
jgi:hypothetical protein